MITHGQPVDAVQYLPLDFFQLFQCERFQIQRNVRFDTAVRAADLDGEGHYWIKLLEALINHLNQGRGKIRRSACVGGNRQRPVPANDQAPENRVPGLRRISKRPGPPAALIIAGWAPESQNGCAVLPFQQATIIAVALKGDELTEGQLDLDELQTILPGTTECQARVEVLAGSDQPEQAFDPSRDREVPGLFRVERRTVLVEQTSSQYLRDQARAVVAGELEIQVHLSPAKRAKRECAASTRRRFASLATPTGAERRVSSQILC